MENFRKMSIFVRHVTKFFFIIIEQNLEVPFVIIVNEIVGNSQWSPDSTGSQSLEIWKLTRYPNVTHFSENSVSSVLFRLIT